MVVNDYQAIPGRKWAESDPPLSLSLTRILMTLGQSDNFGQIGN